MKDILLPPQNSKKRNWGERKPGSLPHFRFLKMGEIQMGSIREFSEEKMFHFRISGNNY